MSMMEQLQGALGGGPPGGLGGGPPGGGPMEIPDPSAGGGLEPPPEEGGSSLDSLDAAEEALHEFIRLDPDEIDRAEAAKALQIVIKLKAANQKSAQAGDMKSVQRALGGGGAMGGPGG